MDSPASLIQIRAPLTAGKNTGSVSSTSPAAPQRYAWRSSARWSPSSTTTTMNTPTPSVDHTSWAGAVRSAGVSRSSR